MTRFPPKFLPHRRARDTPPASLSDGPLWPDEDSDEDPDYVPSDSDDDTDSTWSAVTSDDDDLLTSDDERL